ncbi:hypothetical protein GCM10023222_42080 [Saccharopolyspora cebuensis]
MREHRVLRRGIGPVPQVRTGTDADERPLRTPGGRPRGGAGGGARDRRATGPRRTARRFGYEVGERGDGWPRGNGSSSHRRGPSSSIRACCSTSRRPRRTI